MRTLLVATCLLWSCDCVLLRADSVWTNYFPLLTDIAASPSAYVVAGDSPMISCDLINWERTGPDRSNEWSGIVYAEEKFVAVSQDGIVACSNDGRKWSYADLQPLLPGPADDLRYQGVEYLVGRFIVLSGGILISTNAIDWKVYSKGKDFESYRDVAYSGGKFIAVGNRGTVAVSTNGIDWDRTAPFGLENLSSVTYFASRFLLATARDDIYSSVYGDKWELARRVPGIGKFVVLGDRLYSSGANGRVFRSPDGASWEEIETGTSHHLSQIRHVRGQFFVCSAYGVLRRSTNGLDWESLVPEAPGNWRLTSAAAVGTNRVIIGGEQQLIHGSVSNGWRAVPTPDQAWFYSVRRFRDQFVAAGYEGAIYTSPDGLDWKRQESGTRESLFGLSVANDRVFAGSTLGHVIYSSTNAVDWEPSYLHTNLAVTAVLHVAGRYVAGGARISAGSGEGSGGGAALASSTYPLDNVPTIMISTNLQDWHAGPTNLPSFWCGAYGNGILLLAGHGAFISRDGLTWTATGGPHTVSDAVYANGRFYLSGFPGVLFVSPDGTDWRMIPCSTTYRMYGLAATPNSLVAVGEAGAIVEAPFDLHFGASRRRGGEILQTLFGGGGGPLVIESSADLRSWETFLEIGRPANPLEFPLGAGGREFFRARR